MELNNLCFTKYDNSVYTLVYRLDVRSMVYGGLSCCILIIQNVFIMREVGLNCTAVLVISFVCLFVCYIPRC
jgi:hypothetical protein